MNFTEKISIILKVNKLGIGTMEDLAVKAGFNRDTIRKAVERGSQLNPRNTRTFTDKLGINPDWWETGKGAVFIENPTPDQKAGNNNGKTVPEEIYRDLVESNSEYRLVPKVIMDDYEIVPKTHIDVTNRRVQEIIDAKNDLIQELRNEIAELRGRPIVTPAK